MGLWVPGGRGVVGGGVGVLAVTTGCTGPGVGASTVAVGTKGTAVAEGTASKVGPVAGRPWPPGTIGNPGPVWGPGAVARITGFCAGVQVVVGATGKGAG